MADATWTDLVAAAERLSQLSTDTVKVEARRNGMLRVTEGLQAGDLWVYVDLEPVRWRWRLSRKWHEVQPIEAAASEVETFMRTRPDLRA